MGYLTVKDKGMGQAGGGIVGPVFQMFQTTPVPGLSQGGYGIGISTPYRPPAIGGSGGPIQGTTYAAPTPTPAPAPAPQPQPMPQPPVYQPVPQPPRITITQPAPVTSLPVWGGGGGGGVAPAPTPSPVVEEATIPVILEEEKKADFPWWILLAIPAAMLAMKKK